MIDKAISVAVTVLLAIAAVWFFDGKIRDYYNAPLIDKHNEAIKLQKMANERSIDALAKSKAAIKTVYIDRIKEIQIYEKSLSPDDACRASPEFVRLYNSIKR